MTNEAFEAKLKELSVDIETLPEPQRSRMLKMVEATRQRHRKIRESSKRSHDLLDDWRLAAKYAVFDREATQREAQERRRPPDEE